MSSNRERRQSSLTLGQKVGARVSERFWEARQAVGKDAKGEMQYLESYIDMHSGQDGGEKTFYTDYDRGWNGAPPNLPSGDPGREAARLPPSQRYREQYEKIDWRI